MKSPLRASAILLLLAPSAWAALGQPAASVSSDQQRLGGERRTIAADAYSVEEIASATGTVVREFVSPAGQVFAISWRGPVRPDLRQLLGEHFAAFQRASASAHRGRTLAVRTDSLVVESGGHVRDFHGRAYLPALMPAGVTEASVR